MPDEPTPPSPETPPPHTFGRRVGTGLAGETTRNEGSTILPEANPRPIEVIGDFEVLAKLGQGGMGAVYRARQASLDRQVALKILPSHYEADPDYVARFQREARVASSLSHPNLVKVYASGVANGSHYIAMELIEGETLSQWVKRGALPPLEALRITLDVARALECGWRTAQLIHRDIKPGNIFLSVQGEVKLGDLGLAKIVGSDTTGLTHTGMAMGTPHYISPEQARGDRDLDFRADIYSLGCTLYQMLTGRTPYIGTEPMVVMNQHINAPPPAILKVMPQCPLPLARLVSKMLKKARRERPASYGELIAALETVRWQLDPTLAAPSALASPQSQTPLPSVPAESAGTSAVPGPEAGSAAEGRRGAPKKAALYGIGVLVLVAAAFFLWPREEKLTKAQLYAHDHATELKAAADAETALATATKDAPFVNGLGMKFVPVPILGGPTGGQRVFFSVWDTRVQDYEAFARETKRQWEKPPFEQGPTHPVVMVNWEDAQAFCAWLTERERRAGKLGANQEYRLPSDHEWSCAVGIGEWEDAEKLPDERNHMVAGVFPWGTQWPPPEKAGNYAGEELQPLLAAGKYSWMKGVLPGYDDGFTETSPVGSFAANQFGLYDMGGNVWQWCGDWYDKEQNGRVQRGASWFCHDRGVLLSSFRTHILPGTRYNECGFRCVLAPTSSTPTAVTAPVPAESGASAAATKGAPFVNTLGMKFVPVPIIGGPTGGQRVLFSVWDTRVQDYEVFAKETKRDWPSPGFEQGPTHPAVNVSWEDAQAFCAWLTERERKAGKLGANEVYRLPSDHEWSCAVGIGEREDAAKLPIEKDANIDDVFPWGTQWPPPEKAGNYASEEAQPLLAAGKYPVLKAVLPGYHDGFAETSPVGTFAANLFGLFDMGGNVRQMCEDWYDQKQQDRVLRGGSWYSFERSSLLSSRRSRTMPGYGAGSGAGFRCVLAPATAATVTTFSPSSEPWQDVLHDPAKLVLSEEVERTPEGLRFTGFGSAMCPPSQSPKRDGAVRMLATFGGARPQLRVRHNHPDSVYQLFAASEKAVLLVRYDGAAKQNNSLRGFRLSEPLQPGQDYELELRVVGQTFTAKLNGEVLGTVTDGTYPEGEFGVRVSDRNSGPVLVKVLEVLDLDASGASAAPGTANLSPSTEPWQDVLHDPAKLVLNGGAERTPEGLLIPDNHAEARFHRSQGSPRDGAIRMLATFGGPRPELHIGKATGHYRLTVAMDGKSAALLRYDVGAAQTPVLRSFPLRDPLRPGQNYEIELRVVGEAFTVKLNGETLGTVTDGTSPERGFSVGMVDNPGPALVKALEVLDLDVAGGKP